MIHDFDAAAQRARAAASALLFAALTSCSVGLDWTYPGDAATPDTTVADVTTPDAGFDASAPDAGLDASAPDTAAPDTAAPDAQPQDASAPDAAVDAGCRGGCAPGQVCRNERCECASGLRTCSGRQGCFQCCSSSHCESGERCCNNSCCRGGSCPSNCD